jgi:hypothetical protein
MHLVGRIHCSEIMEFIIKKGKKLKLPTNAIEMENSDWFNMWNNKLFPYDELRKGDTLYWFDAKVQQLVWKTKVISVKRTQYKDKREIIKHYEKSIRSKYYENKSGGGYFLGYKIKVIEKISINKPDGFEFRQCDAGWLRVDNEIKNKWFGESELDDNNTLDDYITKSKESIFQNLIELNERMKDVPPERIEQLASTTIRKDTEIVKALKIFVDYKCQYPSCGHQIIKKDGGFYIEVAHIKPVRQKGQSVLGNLIVLCPNHHKEFDYGDLKIIEQTINKLVGKLNGNDFEIELINH